MGRIFLIILVLQSVSVQAAVRRVPADHVTIQAGIDACFEGDTVLVAPGIYTGEGNRDLDFAGVNLVLKSEAGVEHTTIDCDGKGAIRFNSGESGSSVFEGFTIRDGGRGGEFYRTLNVIDASPTLRDLDFWFCTNPYRGGAAYFDGADVLLQRVRFFYNSVIDFTELGFFEGGALYSEDSHLILEECVFVGNKAHHVYMTWECCPTAEGGAIYATGEGSLDLLRCGFSGNLVSATSVKGTAIYSEVPLSLNQVTIAGYNRGQYPPATVHTTSTLQVTQSVFLDNGRLFSGATELDRCILFGNGTQYPPSGVFLETDPLICGVAGGNFLVTEGSPCLPQGNPWGVAVGSGAVGCLDAGPVSGLEASHDSADGINLIWQRSTGSTSSYRIYRDDRLLAEISSGSEPQYWDPDCESGYALYTVMAMSGAEPERSESALGYRERPQIVLLSPSPGDILPIGEVFTIEWSTNTDFEAIDIELSRNGFYGDYELLFTATADDGSEEWVVTAPYSTTCHMRVRRHSGGNQYSHNYYSFKIGIKTLVVPDDTPDIRAALLELAEGDTLAIKPGAYLVAEGARVRTGVTVLGTGLQASDVLLMPDADQGHILNFQQVQECRLENLTLTGTGTSSAIYSYFAEVEILRCRFIGNRHTTGSGAAIRDQRGSDLTLRECEFLRNFAAYSGGAIYLGGFTELKAIDCLFVGNVSDDNGGVIAGQGHKLNIQGATFALNSCGGYGAAIALWDYGSDSLQVKNSIFYGNQGDDIITCAGTETDFECSVFFGNSDGDVSSCFDADFYEEGNLFVDPLFCSPEAGDYRLDPASPCLPENNDCGVLIGALGAGCENTPVMVSGFTASSAPGEVELEWFALAAADFRLRAERAGASWSIGWTVTAGGRYSARDTKADLALGGEVTYYLEGRLSGEEWLLLGVLAVDLSPVFVTELLAPFPNPFNPRVTIPFTLEVPGRARIEIFDLAGRRVARLADTHFKVGGHELTWDGDKQSSGVYFVKLSTPGFTQVKRLVLLR